MAAEELRRERERRWWEARARENELDEARSAEQRQEQKALVREVAAEAGSAREAAAQQKRVLRDKSAIMKAKLLQKFVAKQVSG